MPRRSRLTPRDVQSQVEAEIETELDDMVALIAAEEGPAKGSEFVSEDKEVELWGQRDPKVDYDSFKAMLMQGALPPEWIDPQSDARLALVRVNPEWSDWLAQNVTPETPLDDEMASQVAARAEWPFREAIWAAYQDDPKAQVARANSVNARWLRRVAAASVVATPFTGRVSGEPMSNPAFDTHAAPSVSNAPEQSAPDDPYKQAAGY